MKTFNNLSDLKQLLPTNYTKQKKEKSKTFEVEAIVDCLDDDKKYKFTVYENTEKINVGDYFIFNFGGIFDVQICDQNTVKEVNYNPKRKKSGFGDLTFNFWKSCNKIKTTNLDLNRIVI